MNDPTPTVRKVRLKRVEALDIGDSIQPGLGLFTRDGTRIQSQAAMTDSWTRAEWIVIEPAELVHDIGDAPEWRVAIVQDEDDETADALYAPLDAWVVLL